MAKLPNGVTITRVAGGTRGVKALYVLRFKGAVIDRYLTRAAAERKAKTLATHELPLPTQQKISIGLFRSV